MKSWWVGIDVCLRSLDVSALSGPGEVRNHQFANNAKGIKSLLKFLRSLEEVSWVGMESTGGYEYEAACAIAEGGLRLCVENPRRIRDFARALHILNKTDKVDARAIALYLQKMEPRAWNLTQAHIRELSMLTRHRQSLLDESTRISNRLSHQARLPQLAVNQLQERLRHIQKDIDEVDRERQRIVSEHPDLQRDVEALCRQAGIGMTTAILLVAEAGDIENYPDAESYAASSGLSPCRVESGLYRGKTRISRFGNEHLRKGLYLPASRAARCDARFIHLRERLLARGLTKQQALVACMRKLLLLSYGILKRVRSGQQPFYNNLQQPLTN
jgi:transposase